MAYTGKLRLGGFEYKLIRCSFSLKRSVDEKGKPTSKIYGGTIHVTIESNEATFLVEFFLNNQTAPIDGAIIITNISQERNAKEISFKKGYIIDYTETVDLGNTSSQIVNLAISAKTLRIGTAVHNNDWTA